MKRTSCRRCSKIIEEIKSCGEPNCPAWNPRDLSRPMIKRDLNIDLPDKYFVENLCNNCSDIFENLLTAFHTVKVNERQNINSPFEVSGWRRSKG